MTDRLEKVKQRNAKVRGFNTELDADWDCLITEVERLQRHVVELQDALRINDGEIERLKIANRALHDENLSRAATIATLRGAIEAYFNFAPGGYVMWEQLMQERIDKDATIATLRGELDKQIDLNEGYVDTATTLREALKKVIVKLNECESEYHYCYACRWIAGWLEEALAATEAPQ